MRSLVTFLSLCFLSACGGGGGENATTGTGLGPTQPTNTAPKITDPGTLSVQEGATSVSTITASDSDGDELSFSLSAGGDRALFEISPAGVLSFKAEPDFEFPGGVANDNSYRVTIQVSDGALTDSLALEIFVVDAFEGRIVDAPIKGAAVFVDLNDNGTQDSGEPSAVTDNGGYFKVTMFDLSLGAAAKVVSLGGTDTLTGEALPSLVLISDMPSDITQPANVTPLTTILAASDTAESKAELLAALGVSGTVEELLIRDSWKAVEAGDADAKAAQRINQQLGMVLQTASTLRGDSDGASAQSVALALGVAAEIRKAAVSSFGLDLTSSTALQTVLTDALSAAEPDVSVEAAALNAVSQSLAEINAIFADPTLDPSSTVAADIVKASRKTFRPL